MCKALVKCLLIEIEGTLTKKTQAEHTAEYKHCRRIIVLDIRSRTSNQTNDKYFAGGLLMNIVALTDEFREKTERIAAGTWGSIHVAAHHELFDLRKMPCFIAVSDNQEVLGYCYYRVSEYACEIMAIESVNPNIGIGSALINAVLAKARNEKCKRVYVNTSNDNTRALRFYQRRGFIMCAVRWNEFDYLRTIKPTIPLIGDDDIPLLHEIELEMPIH